MTPAHASLARAERAALAETLLEVGPDAPTLCTGWTAHDLAAHLVAREARPDLSLRLVQDRFPAAGRFVDRVQARFAERDFADLVATFAAGPPVAIIPVDPFMNAVEYVVHHEDVLRAQPEPRPCRVPDERHEQLHWQVAAMARARLRHSPVGVLVRVAGRDVIARPGMPRVLLQAGIVDLLLVLSGRAAHATYQVGGLPEPVSAFTGWLGGSAWGY